MISFARSALGAVALLVLSACGNAQNEAPPAESGVLSTDMVRTLSEGEAANLNAALAQIPEGSTIVHLVPDGDLVALHYVTGATAVADFIQFDAAHAIANRNRIEFMIDPARQVAGASSTSPQAADNDAEAANKRAIVQFYQTASTSPQDAANNFLSTDFVDHARGYDRAGWINQMTATPFQYGIQSIAAWDDIVAVYVTVGTRQNGRQIYLPGYDFFRFRDGKIVEQWRLNY